MFPENPNQEVKFVRVILTDTSNINRVRIIPAKRFHEKIRAEGQGLTTALLGLPCNYDAVFSGQPVGEVQLVPDMETFQQLPYYPAHAVVCGSLFTNGKVKGPYSMDPRGFLQKCIQKLRDEFNMSLKVGFESEFILLREQPNSAPNATCAANGSNAVVSPEAVYVPVDQDVYADMNSLKNRTTVETLDAIVDALETMGIPVEQVHPESASGQFEVVTAYTDALAAVDRLVQTRVVVKDVAALRGLHATFAPKVFGTQAGSASHAHLSLWDASGEKNILVAEAGSGKEGLEFVDGMLTAYPSEVAKHFMAGVLEHLPSLMALTIPTVMSFERIQPSYWSGAYQVWGVQNRECPLRLSHDAKHFELKTWDSTANPYLALGAILVAGMDGLRRKLVLPPPVQVDPARMSEQELIRDKIFRLPKTLMESQELLKENNTLREWMGEDLFENFLAVKGQERRVCEAMDATSLQRLMVQRF